MRQTWKCVQLAFYAIPGGNVNLLRSCQFLKKYLGGRRVKTGAPEVCNDHLLVPNLLISVCYVLSGQVPMIQQ